VSGKRNSVSGARAPSQEELLIPSEARDLVNGQIGAGRRGRAQAGKVLRCAQDEETFPITSIVY